MAAKKYTSKIEYCVETVHSTLDLSTLTFVSLFAHFDSCIGNSEPTSKEIEQKERNDLYEYITEPTAIQLPRKSSTISFVAKIINNVKNIKYDISKLRDLTAWTPANQRFKLSTEIFMLSEDMFTIFSSF